MVINSHSIVCITRFHKVFINTIISCFHKTDIYSLYVEIEFDLY